MTRDQPALQYLVELRQRLLRSVLLLAACFLALLPFTDVLFTGLAQPLLQQRPEGAGMIATAVASPFTVPLTLAFFMALLLTMPVFCYQLWKFAAPALYRRERRLVRPLLSASIVLFYLGVGFGYTVVLPLTTAFFTQMAPSSVTVMTDIQAYLSFSLKLLLVFGLSFEVPVIVVVLTKMQLVSVTALKRQRAYVIIGAFVLGMLLTPPDVFSQTLLAIPLWLLFELGLLLSKLINPTPMNV